MGEPSTEEQTLVGADRLGRRFGRRWVFRGVSFSLRRGEALVVTGPNGSGKSTLLQILAGLQEPSEGAAVFPPGDLRTRLCYAALDQAVYPALTVEEHLDLAARLRGCPARVGPLLERIGLGHAAEVRAAHLSTGMRGRLKIALAIQPEPAALLLDEPTAGLDEKGRELVASVLAEQRQRGAAVLATNDPTERRLADFELRLGQ